MRAGLVCGASRPAAAPAAGGGRKPYIIVSVELREFVSDQIWLAAYPVKLGGARFEARMTLARRTDGALIVHSPGPVDSATRAQIEAIGRVAVIVAPGNFHHLHVASCQQAFPGAQTWICPGVERKQPALRYDGFLADDAPPPGLAADFKLAGVFGRYMCEVAMLHQPSRTLLLVDLIENFGDQTPGVNWMLKACWKLLRKTDTLARLGGDEFGVLLEDASLPDARELGERLLTSVRQYRFGWQDRASAGAALQRILAWDFERIVIAHGDLIEHDARAVARRAWGRHLQ